MIDANYANVVKRVRQCELMNQSIDLLVPCKNLMIRSHIYIILIESIKKAINLLHLDRHGQIVVTFFKLGSNRRDVSKVFARRLRSVRQVIYTSVQ